MTYVGDETSDSVAGCVLSVNSDDGQYYNKVDSPFNGLVQYLETA